MEVRVADLINENLEEEGCGEEDKPVLTPRSEFLSMLSDEVGLDSEDAVNVFLMGHLAHLSQSAEGIQVFYKGSSVILSECHFCALMGHSLIHGAS